MRKHVPTKPPFNEADYVAEANRRAMELISSRMNRKPKLRVERSKPHEWIRGGKRGGGSGHAFIRGKGYRP